MPFSRGGGDLHAYEWGAEDRVVDLRAVQEMEDWVVDLRASGRWRVGWWACARAGGRGSGGGIAGDRSWRGGLARERSRRIGGWALFWPSTWRGFGVLLE
jgi:hypothetical protein